VQAVQAVAPPQPRRELAKAAVQLLRARPWAAAAAAPQPQTLWVAAAPQPQTLWAVAAVVAL
jgi:hypothetical protein